MLNHSFFRHVFFPKPVAAVAGLSTASSVAAVSSAWTITVPGSTDASDWRTKGPAPQGSPRNPPGGSPRGSPRALGKWSTTVIKIGSLASFGWLWLILLAQKMRSFYVFLILLALVFMLFLQMSINFLAEALILQPWWSWWLDLKIGDFNYAFRFTKDVCEKISCSSKSRDWTLRNNWASYGFIWVKYLRPDDPQFCHFGF